ncbi:hypothetical protein V1517DRAFT_33722 [Lipomyces orientalis]|uniref:Uncharacterized protein n=1 Tax=Lipomyces orientalis TaxID=1233043 RepID=A0ACC3TG44_9ASCO
MGKNPAIVLDAFRDIKAAGFWYEYNRDAHTSLVGLRQHAAESRCFESDQGVSFEVALSPVFRPRFEISNHCWLMSIYFRILTMPESGYKPFLIYTFLTSNFATRKLTNK